MFERRTSQHKPLTLLLPELLEPFGAIVFDLAGVGSYESRDRASPSQSQHKILKTIQSYLAPQKNQRSESCVLLQ